MTLDDISAYLESFVQRFVQLVNPSSEATQLLHDSTETLQHHHTYPISPAQLAERLRLSDVKNLRSQLGLRNHELPPATSRCRKTHKLPPPCVV